MTKPKISVLMPVYNGGRFLKSAIGSILNQTFSDFEFIIINDGSTDNTEEIIDGFRDERIVKINNTNNIGLVKSLNEGLKIVRGELLARMDADDISQADRFKEQVKFMEEHKEVGVLGTQVNHVDVRGNLIAATKLPTDHASIVWQMLFDCPIIHPTVLMRLDMIRQAGGYDNDYKHIEDTELWSRLINVTKLANLDKILYTRRLHKDSIISTQSEVQYKLGLKIKSDLIEEIIGKRVGEEYISWLARPEKILNKEQKNNLKEILKEVNQTILNKYKPDEKTEAEIRDDLNRKLLQIDKADKGKLKKIIISIFKKIIPSPTRHYIKVKILKKIGYNR